MDNSLRLPKQYYNTFCRLGDIVDTLDEEDIDLTIKKIAGLASDMYSQSSVTYRQEIINILKNELGGDPVEVLYLVVYTKLVAVLHTAISRTESYSFTDTLKAVNQEVTNNFRLANHHVYPMLQVMTIKQVRSYEEYLSNTGKD